MDQNLTFYKDYSQSNCLMECRMRKIAHECSCTPWFLNHNEHPICDSEGNACFLKATEEYHDEVKDIEGCDCRPDCEGNYFFTTMDFVHRKFTDYKVSYDESKQTGLLADYLLYRENFFNDIVVTNLTRILYNTTKEGNLKVSIKSIFMTFFQRSE
jgi:hypothetical protein